MINTDLLCLLEGVLGKGRRTSGNNYAFYSPFIYHQKPKLEIDLTLNNDEKNFWHCWVSNERGGSIWTLFKKINVDGENYATLSKILGKKNPHILIQNGLSVTRQLTLPDEYISLIDLKKNTDITILMQLHQAINYLKTRSVTAIDVFRYNIGYCPNGIYAGRLIFPSYDEYYKLNYFVSRTIFDDVSYKYKNPPVDRNIIGFESFINWSEPITLVEGVFDAISARYNVIPLFGKTLQPILKEKLLLRRPPKVIVALDNDASNDSIYICNWLISNGFNTSMIKLLEKDINEIGFNKFSEYTTNTGSIDSFDLMKERILHV